jgi:hypothetical protein
MESRPGWEPCLSLASKLGRAEEVISRHDPDHVTGPPRELSMVQNGMRWDVAVPANEDSDRCCRVDRHEHSFVSQLCPWELLHGRCASTASSGSNGEGRDERDESENRWRRGCGICNGRQILKGDVAAEREARGLFGLEGERWAKDGDLDQRYRMAELTIVDASPARAWTIVDNPNHNGKKLAEGCKFESILMAQCHIVPSSLSVRGNIN